MKTTKKTKQTTPHKQTYVYVQSCIPYLSIIHMFFSELMVQLIFRLVKEYSSGHQPVYRGEGWSAAEQQQG